MSPLMCPSLSPSPHRPSPQHQLPPPPHSPHRLLRAATPAADFSSNNYLSLPTSPLLRTRVLAALTASPAILGSGGSRLFVYHTTTPSRLSRPASRTCSTRPQSSSSTRAASLASRSRETRSSTTQLSTIPCTTARPRASRTMICARSGRSGMSLALKGSEISVFVAVKNVYSTDGTVVPLRAMIDAMDEILPAHDAHLIVDEAHATEIYGPGGHGTVAQLGLENRLLARLHTFGKALAASGAVILTDTLIRVYLLNYACPFIYATSLSNATIIAASCSFDLFGDGTAEKPTAQALEHSTYFQQRLSASLISAARTLTADSPSTTTFDDAASDADYTAFDALGSGLVCSPSRAWT